MNQNCPKCNSENTYQDGAVWTCPECAHEWTEGTAAPLSASVPSAASDEPSVRDANGNTLADGDSVIVLKELKIKGATTSVKIGTKVRNIRLSDAGDGHNIACKIDGVGAIHLKSIFVRKA